MDRVHVVSYFEGGSTRSIHGVVPKDPKMTERLERKGYSPVTLDDGKRAYLSPSDFLFINQKSPGRYL